MSLNKKPSVAERVLWDVPEGLVTSKGEPVLRPHFIAALHPDYDRPVTGPHTGRKWVRLFPGTTNWIGIDDEHLRYPTDEELKTIKWPEWDGDAAARG